MSGQEIEKVNIQIDWKGFTALSRSKVLLGDWLPVFQELVQIILSDESPLYAKMIIEGTAKMKENGILMEEDPEYIARFKKAYSGILSYPRHNREDEIPFPKYYQPYAYIEKLSPEDIDFYEELMHVKDAHEMHTNSDISIAQEFESSTGEDYRPLYYADSPLGDKAFTLYLKPQDSEKIVLFRESVPPPFWFPILREPQEALDDYLEKGNKLECRGK